MAVNASPDATTDISKQMVEEQQPDNTRMALAAAPAPIPEPSTSSTPQQKRQPEQCKQKIMQALLGIVTQPQLGKRKLLGKAEEKEEGEKQQQRHKQQQQQLAHMELSQIELIYRAEGNANVVLALPQFKQVLRLPKMLTLPTPSPSSRQSGNNTANTSISISTRYKIIESGNTRQQKPEELLFEEVKEEMRLALQQQVAGEECAQQQQPKQNLQQQQHEEQQQTQECQLQQQQQSQHSQHEVDESASEPAVNQNAKDLTMEDFVAYIDVIRNLLGSEYVFAAEIVHIDKEADRRWINEQIRADRPAHRRDKEFCGEFGLLLPDATRLPIAFDILLSNLQAKLIGDTYAIEIKPKQGWLLPSDIIEVWQANQKMSMTEVKGTAPNIAKTTTTASVDQKAGTAMDFEEMKASHNSHIASCRYCAMQFLKLRAGKINRRSSYCPLALFSGITSKMQTAIDALLHYPQNNLRIFRNGVIIYDGEKHTYEDLIQNIFPGDQIELFKDLVVACLLKDYTTDSQKFNSTSSSSNNNNSSNRNSSYSAEVNDDDAETVAGQPHLSCTIPSRRAQKRRMPAEQKEVQENKIIESNVMPTNRVESNTQHTTAGGFAGEEVEAGKCLTATTTESMKIPTSTTKTAMATARTTFVVAAAAAEALETYSQAKITEVEMLCLPKSCVLRKILHLQLLAKRHMPALQAAGYAQQTEKSYNALRALLEQSHTDKQSTTLDEVELLLQPSQAYLLGATAMDCSIMLAFQEISMCNQEGEAKMNEEGQECEMKKEQRNANEQAHALSTHLSESPLSKYCVVMPRHNKTFLTKIQLVDLDPKPDSHLCKYIKQTCQALSLFMDVGGDGDGDGGS